ncbi:MAG: BsuBI/PstI family type II restriction endonuclease [Allosphingosinicella sp.]
MSRIDEALNALKALGLPRRQVNDRSALTLLALLDLRPRRAWADAREPLMGITPIIAWARLHYDRHYAPNTRESFRRSTMHQFVQAGLAIRNPDAPERPVNSPLAVYQISPAAHALLKLYGSPEWPAALQAYLGDNSALVKRYAREREMQKIPVRLPEGGEIRLSPGEHSALIKSIIEEFLPRFAPGASLIYAGDTGEKMGYFASDELASLGVTVDSHGKMPDVVVHFAERNWLLLIESVTSHGPVDAKRHHELTELFAGSKAGLVYVTAFPSRAVMGRYLSDIAWETEVWVAEAPTHLIHFNGVRFLGPYGSP